MTLEDQDNAPESSDGGLSLAEVEGLLNESIVIGRLAQFLKGQRYFSDPHIAQDVRCEVAWWSVEAGDLSVELLVHNGDLGLWYVPVTLRSVLPDPLSRDLHDLEVVDLLENERTRDALLSARMPGVRLGGGTQVIDRDQSNSAVVVGSDIFVKLYRRLRRGAHREVDTLVPLSGCSGAPVPKVHDVGVVGDVTVMVAVDFLPSAQDLYAAFTGGAFDDDELCVLARRVGESLAELHHSLREVLGVQVDSFARLKLGAQERMIRSIERCLDHHDDQLSVDQRSQLDVALQSYGSVDLHAWESGPQGDVGVRTQVIHSDLHLGQILLEGSATTGEIVYIDFEGEVLSTSQTGTGFEPVERDLGAMQRSFAYAEAMRSQGDDTSTLAPGRFFEIFLEAYRLRLGNDFVSDDLIRAYAVEKAAYELEYELLARRGLVAIPLSYLTKS